MRVKVGTVLLVLIGCTSKPEANPPISLDANPTLQFSGLDAALKPNVAFAVGVSVSGDISAGSGSATQPLTVTLSKQAGKGAWEQVGQQVASANNEASFNLTLPAGSYKLKAETSGAATLSGESKAFTVSDGETVTASNDGVALSFSEDSYAIKTGALFDVTVEVAESDKLAAGSLVALKMLQDDGSEAGMLMQWQSDKDRMQPPGEAISAEVEDGKAVFKGLFVVDDKDVTKLQAVLEHKGNLVATEGDLSSEAGDMQLKRIRVTDQQNNRLNIEIEPPPTDKMMSVQIYFYKDDDPVTVHGLHGGSGQYLSGLNQNVNQETADLAKDCYKHLAIRLLEDKYAFKMDVDDNFNGNSSCP